MQSEQKIVITLGLDVADIRSVVFDVSLSPGTVLPGLRHLIIETIILNIN